MRRAGSLFAVAAALGCGSGAQYRIELPEPDDGELTLLIGHTDSVTSGALAFDLRDTSAPEFAVEVEEDGVVELGFFRQSLETLGLGRGRVAVEPDATGATIWGARYFTSRVVKGGSVAPDEWAATTEPPDVLARIPPPPKPHLCRRPVVTATVDTAIYGGTSMAVVGSSRVLVANPDVGFSSVTPDGAAPVADLADAPSAFVAASDGSVWAVGVDAHVVEISTATAGSTWRTVATATAAIGFLAHVAVVRGADARARVGVMNVDREVFVTIEGEPAWRRWSFEGDPTSNAIDFDLAWEDDATLLVATGLKNPVRLRIDDADLQATPVAVEGPDVLEFLQSYGFARSRRGLHLLSSGAILTRPMLLEDDVFTADRAPFRIISSVVAIDAFDDGSLLYATRGFLLGVDDANGCVEPERLDTGALRYPTVIDETHGVVLDHAHSGGPSRVLFFDFVEAPPRG